VPEQDVDRMHVRDTVKIAMHDKSRKAQQPLVKQKLNELMMHWRARSGTKPQDSKRAVTLRRRRQRVAVTSNWDYFYYQFYADFARADLIWNYKTREELREALENELRGFLADKDLRGKVFFLFHWLRLDFFHNFF
jgi:DnaJ family protein C protein 13